MQSDPPKQATISKQPPQSKGASTQPALQAPPAPAPPTPAPAQRPSKQPKQPKAQLQPAQLAQPPSVAEDRSKAQAKGEALAATVANLNMDGLNILGRTRDVVVIGPGKSELEPMLAKYAKAQGRVVVPEPSPEKGSFYRSDHFSLAKRGVPMIYFDAGEDLVNGGTAAGAAASADYTDNRYHKPQDEYRDDWTWDGAIEDLTLNYQIGRELADGSAWPNWYPTAEFHSARDASRGGK
jgi:Zn-dependent M28 family amino/carboxypeptidase